MAQQSAEAKGFYKLSWLQRIGYGAGDLAQNLIYQTISIWLLFFYTNVYGLKPDVAAVMFLIVRLVDVLWDPVVGTIVDKSNPKWGKYRSWLVLGGIPLVGLQWVCHLCVCHLCGNVYVLHFGERTLRSPQLFPYS